MMVVKSSVPPRRGTAMSWAAAGGSFLAGLASLSLGLSDDDASLIPVSAGWFVIAIVWLVRVRREEVDSRHSPE